MRKRMKQLIAAAMAVMTLVVSLPAYADEADQYPLKGMFPYTLMTKEIVDARIADGWYFSGDPYEDVGTAVPFSNSEEWAQVNQFKNIFNLNSGKILITLAGLTTVPNAITGEFLSPEEEAVKNEVIKYLNSYDWKNATEYEKAFYTAEYIVNRCEYKELESDGLETNSSYSCLINGYAVCDGFAQAYHLLTRAVGLKSVYISYKFHAFNCIMIDNEWYEMDVSSVANHNLNLASHQKRIKEYLAQPATNTSEYLWSENGLELEFDSTLPNQPSY